MIKVANRSDLWFILLMNLLLVTASGVHEQREEGESYGPIKPINCTFGIPFQLEEGQTLFLENGKIKIQSLGVLEDSRCPLDLDCVWGGEVIVGFKITENGKNISNFNLSISEIQKESSFRRIDRYLINLRDVVPHPSINVKIEHSNYKASLIVHKIDSLVQDLKVEDETTQYYAIIALGSIRDIDVVEPLVDVLDQDNDSYIRGAAAWALGKIGDLRAIDPLIRAFNDNDSYVQWSAAEALAEINESKTVELLIKALDDNSSDVRETAAQALGSIGNT